MYRIAVRVIPVLGMSVGLWAQLPNIYPHSIVNAASFFSAGQPAGSIAKGSIFSIFGTALGPAQGVQVSAFPLQNALSGVTITITQGNSVVSAIPLFVRQDQINAVMPSNAPLGWASLHVVHNNAFSNPSPVYIVNDSVGIFSSTGTGIGPGAINNFVSATSQPANSTASSAKPGQVVTLFATGLGPISTADNQAPPSGTLPTAVELWVGGIPATVSYSGRSPCCSGLDQVSFTVPANAPSGCWVPVEIRTSRATVGNFVSMAIDPKGAPCSDASNPLSAAIVKGGSLGILSLLRMAIHEDVGVAAPVDLTSDFVKYTATMQIGGPFAFAPWVSTPPPGTCTVYPGVSDFMDTGAIPADNSLTSGLSAGTQLTISGSGGKQVVSFQNGVSSVLGSLLPLYSFPNRLFLQPGVFTVDSDGGGDVASIQASITVPNPVTWTNRDSTTNVIRSQPLTVSWSGSGNNQTMALLGVSSDLPSNSSAIFFCVGSPGATGITVPPEVLSAVRPTEPDVMASKSVIYLMQSQSGTFNANGLTTAFASMVYMTGKTVVLQ
jgi:uncharacterized protein (TIGR03437 family)